MPGQGHVSEGRQLRAVVLNWGSFARRGHWSMSGTFWLSLLGGAVVLASCGQELGGCSVA